VDESGGVVDGPGCQGTPAVVELSDGAPQWNSIAECLLAGVGEHPSRPLLRWLGDDGPTELSWSDAVRRASARGAAVAARGPAGGRVVVAIEDRVEWVLTFLGCALHGLAIAPVPASAADDVVAQRARQIAADLVITDGDRDLGETIRCVPVSELPTGSVLAQEDPHISHAGRTPQTQTPQTQTPQTQTPQTPAIIQFTSGTTGVPKAAVLSARAAIGSAEFYARGAGGTDGAVFFNPLPLDHVGGSVAGVLGALSAGGTYLVVPRFDPAIAIEVIRHLRPTVVGLVPTMIIDLLDLLDRDDVDVADFASVVGGATAVDPSLIDEIERRAGITFLVRYGQSEAPCLALSARDDPTEARTRTLGRPLGGRDFCVRDAQGHIVAVGEVGELHVRGPLVISDYLDADGRIRPVVDEQGWMPTGDLCLLDSRGLLHFRARLREVIIRSGENIYPAEVEHVLTTMPGVAEAAVFAIADRRLGEVVPPRCGPNPVWISSLNNFALCEICGMEPGVMMSTKIASRTGNRGAAADDHKADDHTADAHAADSDVTTTDGPAVRLTKSSAPDKATEQVAEQVATDEGSVGTKGTASTPEAAAKVSRGRRVIRWIRRHWVATAAVALLILLGAGAAYQYFGELRPQQQAVSARADAAAAASSGAVAILSYKHGSVDQDNAAAQKLLTGEFGDYYRDFTANVVAPAAKEEAVDTTATVVGTAVQSSTPDTATVLLFINQSTVTRDNATPSLSASSVRVDLVKQDGRWLISKFDPV
jgi:acyl-CoA synthetase (AMP-forming)/AMP-acid ligase II